jgi:hypothetical protein
MLVKVIDFTVLFNLLKGTHLRDESGRNLMLTTYFLPVPSLGLPGALSEIVHTCPFNEARTTSLYRGADKSLARPGRKQTTVTDFDIHISYL